MVPPPNCYHASAYSRWLRSGLATGSASNDRLYYFEAGWYSNEPGEKCAEPKICVVALGVDEC